MSEENVKVITTLKEIRVLNDPYRRNIVNAMALMDRPATAKDIAVFMGEPPSKVNYHVGILYKFGFIDLDHTENINGIIAKFYKRSISAFKIKIEGKNSQAKEVSALRDVIASTFDMTRDRYIAELAKRMDENEECLPEEPLNYEEDLLFSRQVYLTDQDLEELSAFVDRVAKNKGEKGELHDIFVSYIKLDGVGEK